MADSTHEKPALLIIDMVKDNLDPENHFPITSLARQIIAPINRRYENPCRSELAHE